METIEKGNLKKSNNRIFDTYGQPLNSGDEVCTTLRNNAPINHFFIEKIKGDELIGHYDGVSENEKPVIWDQERTVKIQKNK